MAKKEKHFDRIKAIKKASREHAGPHGKAGPHADKRTRREHRMSTKDWLVEAEEDALKFFQVNCLYADETGAVVGSLGMVTVEAPNEKAAIAEAMERRWDPRLEAASCSPRFEAVEIER